MVPLRRRVLIGRCLKISKWELRLLAEINQKVLIAGCRTDLPYLRAWMKRRLIRPYHLRRTIAS